MSKYLSALIIVNPVSGQARGLRLGRQLRQNLENHSIVSSVKVTNRAGDARRWSQEASDNGFDLIIAIGGDGTVGEVVSGQARSSQKIPVAIVPVGTANVIALALAIPWFPGMAIDTILEGRSLTFDVGYLPDLDRHFFLMAAIGYPAKVIKDSPRRLKNLFGIFSYAAAAVRNTLNLDEVLISIEDENGKVRKYEGNTVLLSNIGKIGDINLKVTPDTSAHDGKFDLSIISSRSLWDFLVVIFRMLTWRYRATSRLHHFQASRVTITTDPPVDVQIDGERLNKTPVTADIIASGVQIIVGDRYREGAHENALMPPFNISKVWAQRSRL